MTEHAIATQEEWKAAREELLADEKAHTRQGDELARRRRELPWVAVEKEYSFETPGGTKSLPDLFDGRSQLMIYHFMFGPTYTGGCPVCSSIADDLNANVPHVTVRDVTLICSSRASSDKLEAYKQRMGWSFGWVSTVGPEFHRDLGFLHAPEEVASWFPDGAPSAVVQNAEACGVDDSTYVTEGPGLSVYAKSNGTVYRTYSSTARGLEPAMGYYGLLDRTPLGRREEGEDVFWLRRHDEY